MSTSIRKQIAVSVGSYVLAVLILYATIFTAWFHHEQHEVLHDAKKGTPEEVQFEEIRGDTIELVMSSLATLAFVIVVSIFGSILLAKKLVRPLEELAQAAKGINALSLDQRLPQSQKHEEIRGLSIVLNELLNRLERSFIQATRFSADASHELRTPLAVMRSELENAIEHNPLDEHAPLFVKLLEENQRLTSITGKLLLLARADAGRLPVPSGAEDISAIVEDTVNDISILAIQSGLQLTSSIEPGLTVKGDYTMLRQLVLNMLENSIRHNKQDGWIQIVLEKSDSHAVLRTSNSGPQIPPDTQHRVFDRFFRLDASRNRASGGAGLGLSLCREIAENYGGSLRVVGSDQNATTFEVFFPLDSHQANRIH